jgi:hypothetical protein
VEAILKTGDFVMKEKDYTNAFEANDFWLLVFIAASLFFFMMNNAF